MARKERSIDAYSSADSPPNGSLASARFRIPCPQGLPVPDKTVQFPVPWSIQNPDEESETPICSSSEKRRCESAPHTRLCCRRLDICIQQLSNKLGRVFHHIAEQSVDAVTFAHFYQIAQHRMVFPYRSDPKFTVFRLAPVQAERGGALRIAGGGIKSRYEPAPDRRLPGNSCIRRLSLRIRRLLNSRQ